MKEVQDIFFLTLTLGWKNENRPSGPTELDLEAGNLVIFLCYLLMLKSLKLKISILHSEVKRFFAAQITSFDFKMCIGEVS